MRCAWLIVILLLCSGFVSSGIVVSENAGICNCAEKLSQSQWVEVDRISKTIEVDPLSSYYFQIKNSTLLENGINKLPISNALKRVPNWLRDDLEKNLKQLANATVDVGDQAAPALFDFDEDGDLDIIVGTADGYMYIYEQKNNFWVKAGTLNDSAGSPIYAGSNAVPCFEDMNGDGYLDLVVGTWDGQIKCYENTSLGWIYNGYLVDNNQTEIDVGGYSAPVFGKVYMHPEDPDGLDWDDLTIGDEDGNIYCYENTRNGTSPTWTIRDNVYQDVNLYLLGLEHPAAYSKPALADLDGDGDLDLTVGVDSGKLYYFRNDGTATSPSWTYVSGAYANFEACAYPAPHFGDLDRNKLLSQDCVFDLVVGRGDGHIHIFKNLGSVNTPRWDVWPNAAETIEHHMDYQDLTRLDKYLNLICDVENKYVDEIAFCIAHTSPDVLADEDVYPEVFVKNAELIYEIDNYIQYADIVYRGSNTTGDYWSTVEYNYYNNTTGMIEKHELPRDIYYWYIVHPKITDEIPTFINPDTGDVDKNGYFWREYLFFYADDTYPDDPDTDPNNDGIPDYNYPKDEQPPSLKDKIANITVLYDGIPYVAPKGHDNDGYMYEPEKNRSWQWSYNKGHAIEIVSNWVEKTLTLNEQESNDGERPIQPVRIAHHHNGNCGELQDLTVAAARTCLIPAAGVNLIGEDHVWSEFYCNNSWHQWDNYWSDSGSVIDKFNIYWDKIFDGQNHRGGSGIFRWNGDDSIDDRTADYVPTAATITIIVTDANDNPVDGARVLVSSYWLVDNQVESITGMSMGFIHLVPNTAVPSIWDYTDSNGICEFRLVGSFQIAIASKLGSTTSDMDFEDGESYTPTFKLQDTSPNPHPKAEEGMPSGEYVVEITYDVLQGVQIQPPSPIVEDMHFENVPAHIDLFTCTEDEMENFMCGKTFNYIAFQSNRTSGTLLSSSLSGGGYIVFSNGDGIETSKIINVTIILKRLQDWAPTVTISNISMPISGLITVSGAASSQSAGNIIKNVWVKVDDSAWYLANGTNSWNYGLDITFYYLGNHTIYVRAIDGGNCYAVANRTWLFEDYLVDITMVEPLENEIISGAAVQVGGTAVDYDGTVELIEIRLANETWREVTDRQNNDWSSTLDATVVNDGIQKIYVKAFDGILYSIKEISVVVDNTYPTISVSSPENNEYVSGTVTVSGSALDINGIKNIWVKVDGYNWTEINIQSSTSLTWTCEIDTTLLSEGYHTIYAQAYDGKHNQTASVTVIVDNNKPPEVLYSPTANSVTIYENSTQEFRILDIRDMESQAISIIWYLDGKNITFAYNKYSYNFSANYSSASSYQIRVEVWDSFWSKEAATQTWTLTVVNVNRIPEINCSSPEIRELTINELENILFYANASDPDGESLSIEWKVNNISKSTGKSYTFSTNYLSAGVYTIAVRVSDGKDAVEQIWRVRVLDINTPPSAGFSPDQKEQTIKKNTQRLFSVENISDSENDELTITWYVNGNAVSEVHISPGDYSDYTYTFTSSGRYVISVSVSDGKTAISNTWLVNVEQPPTEKTIPGFEMQIFLIALSIATIILLAKRKKESD